RGVAAADQDPVLAAAVAAEGDVAGEAVRGREPVALLPPVGGTLPLGERPLGGGGEADRGRRGARSQLREQLRAARVERHLGSSDQLDLTRARMLEEDRDRRDGAVGREAQPPLAVGPHHVDQELVRTAPGAATAY